MLKKMQEQERLNRSIIIIDKPRGLTSFDVTNFVRKSLGLNKAAHCGTLDPEVTGVLPILLGHASRLLDYFIHREKEYVGIMHVHELVQRKEVEKTIKEKFLGKIKQTPPKKSRVKRQEREREIKEFEILEQEEKDFLFRVRCEAGTYIRKLVHDLGKELGTGAHMAELRRIKASIFSEQEAITLYEFQKAIKENNLQKHLIPVEIIKKIMPSAEVKPEAIEKLKHGSPLFAEMLSSHENFEKEENIAVFSGKKLLEVAKSTLASKEIKKSNEEEIIATPRTVLPILPQL